MFENSGKKIKKIAKIMFYVLTICFIIIGISYFFTEVPEKSMLNPEPTPKSVYVIIGLVFIFAGPFASYAASLLVYGFGELVANSDKPEKNRNNTYLVSNSGKQKENKNNTYYTYDASDVAHFNGYALFRCPNCTQTITYKQNAFDPSAVTCPHCKCTIHKK